jgi:hypothetical protein
LEAEEEDGRTLQKKLSLRPMMHSQNSLLFTRYWAAHTSGLPPLRAIGFASPSVVPTNTKKRTNK